LIGWPIFIRIVESLLAASQFTFPDDRRAALVKALAPLNEGNPSLDLLAQPGTVAVVTGQQVGLFSGPAYTVYKALSAIKAAHALSNRGVPAVPVFWLATEDHDFAEVDHVWVFDANDRPVKVQASGPEQNGSHPVGGIGLRDIPLSELRNALSGLPFADETVAMIERGYAPGETMGSAFGRVIKEMFGSYGLLLVDPMNPALRKIAAPLMRSVVERMPELAEALIVRSTDLVQRGYHAQVLVDRQISLAFLLQDGQRLPMRRINGDFLVQQTKFAPRELMDRAEDLSPNALLRPVVEDYLFPTAAYIGGPAELAYLAQSQVLYAKLLGRQPAAFPRAGFTLVDERTHKRMVRYNLNPPDLFAREQLLHDVIAKRLVPASLNESLDRTRASIKHALDTLSGDLHQFDITLAAALETSRRKIEYQTGKIARKTANQIMARNEQATRDASSLSNLVYPHAHLQERLYSIVPFLGRFGPGLIGDLYSAVQIECPDHQFAVI
jgi:bacillithiol biosynthesis cysteine-adding enzyme BshC